MLIQCFLVTSVKDNTLRTALFDYVISLTKGEGLNSIAKKALMVFSENKENREELGKVLSITLSKPITVTSDNFAIFKELFFMTFLKIGENEDEFGNAVTLLKKIDLITMRADDEEVELLDELCKKEKLFPLFKSSEFWRLYVETIISDGLQEEVERESVVTCAFLSTIKTMKKLKTSKVFRLSKLSIMVNKMVMLVCR